MSENIINNYTSYDIDGLRNLLAARDVELAEAKKRSDDLAGMLAQMTEAVNDRTARYNAVLVEQAQVAGKLDEALAAARALIVEYDIPRDDKDCKRLLDVGMEPFEVSLSGRANLTVYISFNVDGVPCDNKEKVLAEIEQYIVDHVVFDTRRFQSDHTGNAELDVEIYDVECDHLEEERV